MNNTGKIMTLILMASAASLSGRNLIKNGSFEQWNEKVNRPYAWGGEVVHAKKVFKQTAETAADGKYSIVWTNSRQTGINQWVPVKGGKYYRFSCKTKYNINPWHVMFRVSWRGKGKTLPGAQMRLRNGLQNEWSEVVIDNLRAPEGAEYAIVRLGPYGGHNLKKIISKDIYVDDVKFEEFTPLLDKKVRNLASVPLAPSKLKCTVDGKDNETFWRTAAVMENFLATENLMVAKLKSSVRVAADKENIYVFAKLYSPDIDAKLLNGESRDKIAYNGDIFEFFLDPVKNPGDDQRRHYQFAIKPSGVLSDYRNFWAGKIIKETRGKLYSTNTKWNCAGLRYKTKVFDGYWTAEFAVPLRSLGISELKKDTEWFANFTRSIYKNVEEYTSWQPLLETDFQNRTNWGRIRFTTDQINISQLAISDSKKEDAVKNVEAAMLMSNCSNAAKDVKITLYDWDKNGTKLKVGEKIVKLPPKAENLPVSFFAYKGKNLYVAEFTEQGRLVSKISCKPFGYYAAIRTYDPQSTLGNKLYLASGIRSFKPFLMESNFPGKEKWGVHRIRRKTKAFDLVCDLPAGVEALTFDVSGWGEYHHPVKPILGKKSKKHGTTYQEYIFKLPCISPSIYTNMMFFRTDWKPGRKGMAYLKLRWKEGEQVANAMPIEVLALPEVPRMKTYVRWDFMTPEFAYQWYDKPAEGLLYHGINTFPLAANPDKIYRPIKKTRTAIFDRIVRELDEKNFYYCLQEDSAPHAWNWTHKTKGDPEACYKDIHNKNVMTQFGYPTFCQLYRGRWYQNWIRRIAKSPAIAKYACTWLILDMEYWSDPDGCFCARCLKTYPQWCKERNWKTGGDPRKFMADRKNNPVAVKQWMEFNQWRFVKLFMDIRKDVMKGLPAGQKRRNGFFAKPMISEWRSPNFAIAGAVDLFEAPNYYEPETTRGRIAVYAAKLGEKYENLAFALAPAPTWAQNQHMIPEDNIYNFFEAAAHRGKGFEIYSTQHMEMRNLLVMNQALRALAIIEDIYLDGRLKYPIACSGGKTTAQAVLKDSEAIVYIRDYNVKKPFKAQVSMPLSGTVYDCRTLKKLGKAVAGKPFTVEISKTAKGRMLYVGTDAKFAKRIKILK